MKKSELYYQIKSNEINLENFDLISKEDYEKAVSDDDPDVYKEANNSGTYYFRTTGANKDTFLEIQFKIYKCIKTIKNIIVFSFVCAIISAVILLITLMM